MLADFLCECVEFSNVPCMFFLCSSHSNHYILYIVITVWIGQLICIIHVYCITISLYSSPFLQLFFPSSNFLPHRSEAPILCAGNLREPFKTKRKIIFEQPIIICSDCMYIVYWRWRFDQQRLVPVLSTSVFFNFSSILWYLVFILMCKRTK